MVEPRDAHRYTAYFCEENVWWLAAEMRDSGFDTTTLSVLLFSNPHGSIAVLQQRAARSGALMAWDYHVVLSAPVEGVRQIYDLDTRLPFPCPQRDYLTATFPRQQRLPARWRSLVRQIPGDAYLDRFCSDRSHMLGRIPVAMFPAYPMICPTGHADAIMLADYCDMNKDLDDGSVVMSVEALTRIDHRPDSSYDSTE